MSLEFILKSEELIILKKSFIDKLTVNESLNHTYLNLTPIKNEFLFQTYIICNTRTLYLKCKI